MKQNKRVERAVEIAARKLWESPEGRPWEEIDEVVKNIYRRSVRNMLYTVLPALMPDVTELEEVIGKSRWRVTGNHIDNLHIEAEPTPYIANMVRLMLLGKGE